MRQPPGAAREQWQSCGDHGMRRQIKPQRLRQHEAEHAARFGIIGQTLAGVIIDERIEIGEPTQSLLRNGQRERSIIAAFDGAEHGRRGLIERITPAQYGINEAQRGKASGNAGDILRCGRMGHRAAYRA